MKQLRITILVALLALSHAAWSAPLVREVDIDGSKVRFEYSLTPTNGI